MRAFVLHGKRDLRSSDIDEPPALPGQLAMQQGADGCLDGTDKHFNARALDLSSGGFDVVFEVSGAEAALGHGIAAALRGATIVQVGTLPTSVTLPLNAVMAKELSLIGWFRFANVFQMALDPVYSKRIDFQPLISAVLPLSDMQNVMNRAISKNKIIKIQIEP